MEKARETMRRNKLIPITVSLLFYILAWVFDSALTAIKTFRSQTFRTGTLWLDLLIWLIFAALVILLVWLNLVKYPPSAPVSAFLILLGVLALFQTLPLHFLIPRNFGVDVPPRYIRDDYSIIIQALYGVILAVSGFLQRIHETNLFTFSAALLTVLGIVSFFPSTKPRSSI
jgi:hypothetical protein